MHARYSRVLSVNCKTYLDKRGPTGAARLGILNWGLAVCHVGLKGLGGDLGTVCDEKWLFGEVYYLLGSRGEALLRSPLK